MKKFFIILLVFTTVSVCFGAGKKEFDPTPTPFEGEWFTYAVDKDGNDIILSRKFTGNKWEDLHNGVTAFTGLFTYNKNEIVVHSDNNSTYRFRYYLFDLKLYIQYKNTEVLFIQEPRFSIINDLWNNKESLDNFLVNQAELASIQGTWRHTNRQAKGSTYTFSGNEFILDNRFVGKVITGTIKINDGILIFVVDDKPFGIFYYEFQPGNRMYLSDIKGYYDGLYGPFKKQ